MSINNAINKYLEKNGFEEFNPRAVLFDMDGVLLDSMGNHAHAWVEAMKSFGINMSEHDAYMTEGQRGIDTIRQMVLQQKNKEIDVDTAQAMYDEKARLFHLMPTASIMPGIMMLLKQIKYAQLDICVVTGSGQRLLIDRLTNDFGEYITEEKIITAYDVKKGKPDAEPYLAGMKRCKVQPWQTIIIENAPLGVRAGVASGAFTIAVNTGPLPDKVLEDEGANLLFHSMKELSGHFEELLSYNKH